MSGWKEKFGNISPIQMATGLNVATGIFGAIQAGAARRDARNAERKARNEMNRLKSIYSNLDTSNPYLNMENTMEDLTINQKQAQFEAQQNQQTQSNVLNTLRSSAGGSGIAALAQSMARQGQLSAQRASASIGQQEAANQRMAAQQAGYIQTMERQGEVISRNWRRDQVGTLLGMAQQETAAARQQGALAQQAKMQAISSSVSNISSLAVAQAKIDANMEDEEEASPENPSSSNSSGGDPYSDHQSGGQGGSGGGGKLLGPQL